MPRVVVIMSVILAYLSQCVPASAGWAVYKSATTRNSEKHILGIEKLHTGKIRAFFQLDKNAAVQFSMKLPLYQIDNNEVHALQSIQSDRLIIGENDNRVRWLIYSGEGPLSDTLLEFMNGKEAVFQYYLPDGTIKETIFDLEGAREAIETLFE